MNWFDVFASAGAVWRWPGHGPHPAYRLSDHHADFYFNTDIVTAEPNLRERVVREGLAPLATSRPDVVASPLSSIRASVSLGQALAQHLGVSFAAFDLNTDSFATSPLHGQAVICTDDIHGGGSARQTVRALRQRGVHVGRIVTLANFSAHLEIEDVPVASLITHDFGVWAPSACPLCRTGSPAIDPRGRWADLARSASDTK